MNQLRKILLVMIIGVTTLMTTTVNAQRGEDYTIVNSSELYNAFNDGNTNNKSPGFCHDINVTVDLTIFEIETTITICCLVEYFTCLPRPGNRVMNSAGEYPNDLEIVTSATVTEGQYAISIVPGRYDLNKKGEITNLRYKLSNK
jgi:hypothetical protein